MRIHTQKFKDNIKELGREIESKITFDDIIITGNQLAKVCPITNSIHLKSVMKELDFESYIQIPKNTIIKYEFGLKVDDDYEYLNYGNYVVFSSEYNEDTKTYEHVCYDKMLFSMKEYKSLQHGTFPMTVRDYIKNICLDLGLIFKNSNSTFANYDKVIDSDLYANLDYTYRDILDELSQVTASNICIDTDDNVEIRYLTNTNDTINESFLKDVNVKFGPKYGPINSIVLSRSAESDNIYLQDEQSVETNGLCEIKIKDNQIMNFNNRDEFLEDILERLNGIEYYINDFSSTGVLFYEACDKYNVSIGENTYNCVLFNSEPEIAKGIVENIYTEFPKETTTDYTKSDKTDRRINQTYLIVDKQNQKIESVISQTDEQNQKIVNITLNTEMISNKVEENINRIDAIDKSTSNQIESIRNATEELQTSTQIQFNVINETFADGVPKVKTTSGTFDEKGLNIAKQGEEMNLQLTNEGLYVNRSYENILAVDSSGVNAINLHARQYLSIGTHSRWEDYEDGTGCFDMN